MIGMNERQDALGSEAKDYWKVVVGHRQEYSRRPALQMVYEYWAGGIKDWLSEIDGLSVELGCGCGALSTYFPEFVKTDIFKHEWVDEVIDACAMSYKDGECANLIAVDVLHHLPSAAHFFNEVNRVLRYGGRLILLEPYISPLSYIIYRYFHHEPVDMKARPFDNSGERGMPSNRCNEGLPTLVFDRYRNEFNRRWPELKIVRMMLRDFFAYPLTGGFSGKCLLPKSWVKPLMKAEDVFVSPFGRLNAMRIFVVIEKSQKAGA